MSIRFMIVDDTKFMRKMLTDILSDMKYEVVGEADNGTLAVQMYKKLRPDVTFLDIYMPEVDGIEAMRQIRSIDPNAIVIVCSGTSQQYLISDAMKLGANGYVMKPFKPKQILEVIQKYVIPALPGKDRADRPASESARTAAQEAKNPPPLRIVPGRGANPRAAGAEPETPAHADDVQAEPLLQPFGKLPAAAPDGQPAEPARETSAVNPPAAEAGIGGSGSVRPEADLTEEAGPTIGSASAAEDEAEPAAETSDARAVEAEPVAETSDARAVEAEPVAETSDARAVEADLAAEAADARAVEAEPEAEAAGAGAAEPEQAAVSGEDPARHESPEPADIHAPAPFAGAGEEDAGEDDVSRRAVPVGDAEAGAEDDRPVLPHAEIVPIPDLRGALSTEVYSLKEFKSCISCRWKEDVDDREVAYHVTWNEGEPYLRIETSTLRDEMILSFDGLRNLLHWLDKHASRAAGPRKEVARPT